MRIDELMKIALDNKYTIERRCRAGHDEIALYSHHYGIDRQVVRINNEVKGILFISNGSSGVNDLNVIKASIEYAETDPEDREEEKKFYAKHRYFEIAGGGRGFFTIDNESGVPFLENKTYFDNYNQIFTLKEIEEIKKKFDTDLKDFELVEVVDE